MKKKKRTQTTNLSMNASAGSTVTSGVHVRASTSFCGCRLFLKSCHEDPFEITPGLFVGSKDSAVVMAHPAPQGKGVDVLVPLDSLDAKIWDMGFRGDILYYPTDDYGALRHDVLERCVESIVSALSAGKKVGIFCLGGHGRTGYVAGAVIGTMLGVSDPISYLREKYCANAVESNSQITSLAEFLGNNDLLKHRVIAPVVGFGRWDDWGYDTERVSTVWPATRKNDAEDYFDETACATCYHLDFDEYGYFSCELGRSACYPWGRLRCDFSVTAEEAKSLLTLCERCANWGKYGQQCLVIPDITAPKALKCEDCKKGGDKGV